MQGAAEESATQSGSKASAVELLRRGLARGGGKASLTVRGNSMLPALADGDRIEVVAVSEVASLRPGQLVVAQATNGELICHRLLSRDRDGALWLAGDANPTIERITIDRLIGVVAREVGVSDALRARVRWFAHRARERRRGLLRRVARRLR